MKRHKRQPTREERTLLKLRVLCLLWALFLVLVLVLVDMDAEVHEEEPAQVTQFETGLQPIPVVQAAYKAPIVIEVEAVPQATEQIDVDPTRDDIPLDKDTQVLLYEACGEFGIDYYIMVALIERETNFNNITGDKGNAYGYCQIWPKWWSGLMAEIGAKDLMNPYDNFRTACAILSKHLERYGNIEDALTCYNTGKSGESLYASAIMSRAEAWKGGVEQK